MDDEDDGDEVEIVVALIVAVKPPIILSISKSSAESKVIESSFFKFSPRELRGTPSSSINSSNKVSSVEACIVALNGENGTFGSVGVLTESV